MASGERVTDRVCRTLERERREACLLPGACLQHTPQECLSGNEHLRRVWTTLIVYGRIACGCVHPTAKLRQATSRQHTVANPLSHAFPPHALRFVLRVLVDRFMCLNRILLSNSSWMALQHRPSGLPQPRKFSTQAPIFLAISRGSW